MKTKSPATSEGTGEHGVRSSQRVRREKWQPQKVSEGAEPATPRTSAASQREGQHITVRSVFEIGGMLGLTFSPVNLSPRVQLPTRCSIVVQYDAIFEITTKEVSFVVSDASHGI